MSRDDSSPGLAPFDVVVAADASGGIGKDGGLPWRLPGELAYFKRVTSEAPAGKHNVVVMGRKTYDSIAPKFRPLRDRRNIVLSHDPRYRPEGAEAAHSLDEALALAASDPALSRVFVIGGGALYRVALGHPRCERIYLTRVHETFDCDTFLPALPTGFVRTGHDGPHVETSAERTLSYTFEVHQR